MDKRLYDEFYHKSISGEDGYRSIECKTQVSYPEYLRSIRTLAESTALAVGVAIGANAEAIQTISDNLTINQLAIDFYVDYMTPFEGPDHLYDYSQLADKIDDMDDPDIGYYLFSKNTDDSQMDPLFQATEYGSFAQYLESHHCDDIDEWKEAMRDKIILMADMDEKEEELDQMYSEQPIPEVALSYGGAK